MSEIVYTGKQKNKTEVDHIYFNMTINNITSQIESRNSTANFSESTLFPLIYNPSEYYLSVIRFIIPGSVIPLFAYPIVENSNPPIPDDTFYSVTISWGTFNRQVFLIYVPSLGPDVTATPSIIGVPYPVYYYQHFINMINSAFRAAFIAIVADGAPVTDQPYMLYNCNTQKFSIIATDQYYPAGGLGAPKIYVNSNLGRFFDPIYHFYNSSSTPFGKSSLLIIQNNYNNSVTTPGELPGVASPGYEMISEYDEPYAWRDFRNIVFISGNLSSRVEMLTDLSGDGKPIGRRIITDYSTNTREFGRPTLEYIPQAEYRLIDLVGNDDINSINISAYWQDKSNRLYPLIIPRNEDASLKLIFRKKYLGSKYFG